MHFAIRLTLLCAILSIGVSQATADQDTFSSVKVTDKITMLQGKGGNIALLKGKQGLVMVDDDYQDMSAKLIKALKSFGGAKKIAYLINTHWHGDHTGGNFKLGKYTQIVAHKNVRARLQTEQEIKLFNMKSKPYPTHALPSVTYTSSMGLHINDENIEILHLPNGHTDGDSIVFFETENVVHLGDHFFSGMFPFIDVDTGGNVLGMARNIQAVLSRIDASTKIIPGHGPLSTKTDLYAFLNMLLGTTEEVENMMEAGLDITAMQSKGLSSKWDEWKKRSFLNEKVWIGIIHASLQNGL